MALAGGSADKTGNVYESYWTIAEICHLIQNEDDSAYIYFEKPGEGKDGFEYVVEKQNQKFYAQVKNYDKNYWTIADLKSSNIIENFVKKIDSDPSSKCVFYTSCNTELNEIIDRVSRATDLSTFYNSMVTSKKDVIEKIHQCLVSVKFSNYDRSDEEKFNELLKSYTYNLLRHIEIHIKDKITLEEDCKSLVKNIFLTTDSDSICKELFNFSQENYNKKYTKLELIRYLKENKGYTFNNLNINTSLISKIEELNNNYINNVSVFYEKYKITREETYSIYNAITEKERKYLFLLGSAGSGKSIILKEVAQKAKEDGCVIIPIDVRLYEGFNNSEELGECLYNCRISPVDVLANLSCGKTALLIIDQLDSLSSVSGRSLNKWNVIENLLQRISNYPNIKVLIACRSFDLDRDSRFKEFAKKNENLVKKTFITNLSNAVVKESLLKLGVNKDRINDSLIKLFSIPLHLQMLFAVAELKNIKNLNYQSRLDIFNEFWDAKKNIVGNDSWQKVILVMLNYLNSHKKLTAPVCIFDSVMDSLEKLISEGVLTKEEQNIMFFHETFYDYCFARNLASNQDITLLQFILDSNQNLFIRSNVRQTLEYLRYADFERYISELNNILNNDNVRIHIKTLILELLLSFDKLNNQEIQILIDLKGPLKKIIFDRNEYKQAEFIIKYNTGEYEKEINSQKDDIFNNAAYLLYICSEKYINEVNSVIEKLNEATLEKILLAGYPNTMSRILFSQFLYKNDKLYKLLIKLLKDNKIHIKSLWGHLQYVMSDFITLEQVFDLFEILLINSIENYVNNKESYSRTKDLDIHNLDEYIKKAPLQFLNINFKHLVNGMLKSGTYEYQNLIFDHLCSFRTYGYEDNYIQIFRLAFRTLAEESPDKYINFINEYLTTRQESILYFILDSFNYLPSDYADFVISFIINNFDIYKFGYSSDLMYLTQLLINKFTKFCNLENLNNLISIILNYKSDDEIKRFIELKKEYKDKLTGGPIFYTQAHLLGAIDDERLYLYPNANQKLCEFKRKFKKDNFIEEPFGIKGGLVMSPISKDIGMKMTLSQWERAIYKYNSPNPKDVCIGGAIELSRVLEEVVKQRPLEFINFIFDIKIEKVFPYYIKSILSGLASLEGHYEEKENLIKYCFALDDKEFTGSIITLLGSYIDDTGVHLSQYDIDLITKYIINPEYNNEWDNSDDIDMISINCNNGSALWLLHKILCKDISYKKTFSTIIDNIDDYSMATRVACIIPLYPLYNDSKEYALSILQKIIVKDPFILKSNYVREFIIDTARSENFNFYNNLLNNIQLDENYYKRLVSGIFTRYGLEMEKTQNIALKYIESDDNDIRQEAARVFSQYAQMNDVVSTRFYQENFEKLVNGKEIKVSQECLHFIYHINNISELFDSPLFNIILNSKTLFSDTHIFYTINEKPFDKNYLKQYKAIIYKYIDLKNKNLQDNETSYEIGKLFDIILKVYEYEEDSEILDLIDSFLQVPVAVYHDLFKNFERAF